MRYSPPAIVISFEIAELSSVASGLVSVVGCWEEPDTNCGFLQ